MYPEGLGVEQIASSLEKEEILVPTACSHLRGLKNSGKAPVNGQYARRPSTVHNILQSGEYCGDVINFKTYSKSFKNKKRFENALENQMIFEDVHTPIAEREIWQRVQERYGIMRTSL